MSDGLWLRVWPYQDVPRRPEPADDTVGEAGRVPGLIDETN